MSFSFLLSLLSKTFFVLDFMSLSPSPFVEGGVDMVSRSVVDDMDENRDPLTTFVVDDDAFQESRIRMLCRTVTVTVLCGGSRRKNLPSVTVN